MINGQAFLVSGPYSGYTAFGQAVQYWQLTNRDKFLLWDDGGDWKEYVHPGEITLRYDAGITRLLIYNNELRRWYYRGNLTSDTIQWIDNLTSTNAWPTTNSMQHDSSSPADEVVDPAEGAIPVGSNLASKEFQPDTRLEHNLGK